MTENIAAYLEKSGNKIKKCNPLPIIVWWMNSPHKEELLTIIDKLVKYLLENHGEGKLKQWFFAGDENFNAITAERYIVHYLQQVDVKVVDNLGTTGADAFFQYGNSPIGIEITTLNGFIGEWILLERLTEFLYTHDYLNDKALEITYSHTRLRAATRSNSIYDYVRRVGEAIVSSDIPVLSELGLSAEINSRYPGNIVWHPDDNDLLPWFQYATDDLKSKLGERSKKRQLARFSRNLVFIGINHCSPSNSVFPRVFENLENSESYSHPAVQELANYWALNMIDLTNVIGICYFLYDLERETPFYPLKIFWRSQEDKIDISL